MTTEKPEASSIGQGKNSYSNVQLSRYITAVANKGTVFKLSLLDKMTDSQENLLEDFTPEVRSVIDVKDSTWNAVHTGMRRVISDGSARKIFRYRRGNQKRTPHQPCVLRFLCTVPESRNRGDGKYSLRIFVIQRGDGREKYISFLLRIYRPELHSE